MWAWTGKTEPAAVHVHALPLAEIRRRLAAAECPAATELIRALAMDPRRGARALARSLERQEERGRALERRWQQLVALERRLQAEGYRRIAGVDEVGVGPLAGPVVAAAVVLPPDARLPGLDDSKRLRRAERERLDALIRDQALALSLGHAEVAEIDRLNVHRASRLAMERAVRALPVPPDLLLVDARQLPGVSLPQRALIGGDARVACIAAASVVAKVHRDALMRELERTHPGYGFARNAGYGTPAHLRALADLGPAVVHRVSFAPVRASAARAEAE